MYASIPVLDALAQHLLDTLSTLLSSSCYWAALLPMCEQETSKPQTPAKTKKGLLPLNCLTLQQSQVSCKSHWFFMIVGKKSGGRPCRHHVKSHLLRPSSPNHSLPVQHAATAAHSFQPPHICCILPTNIAVHIHHGVPRGTRLQPLQRQIPRQAAAAAPQRS